MNQPVPAGAANADDVNLVIPGRGLAAGAGVNWIGEGWGLFTRAPLVWVIAIVILFVIAVIVSLVPIVGSIAFQLITPVFAGGLVVACRSLESGGEFELEHLFAGFKSNLANLLIVGLLYMLGWIVILLAFGAFVGLSVLGAVMAGHAEEALAAIMASTATIILGLLVAMSLGLLLAAAYWFAPALVMLHGMAPVAAMKESFFACFRNFLPFLIYGIVMLVLAVVAMLPFGLGLLVWMPLAVTSTYRAYRQIFTDEGGT